MIPAYVLIIGAMKSGTTTVFDLLATHPSVAPCAPKEPGFFAFEDQWTQGFEWYEALFDFDPQTHVYGLDGSTDYSKYPYCTNVVDRLEKSAPRRFKIIYILRDPLSRIESHARHVQHKRKEIGQHLSEQSDHSLDAGVSPVSLAISRYASQLDQYRSYYEAGDLLIITFEEMMNDQQKAMHQIQDFLGLERTAIEARHSNNIAAKRRPGPVFKILNNLGALSRLVKALIPKFLRRALRARMEQEVIVKGRFRLTVSEREALLAELEPDLIRLHKEYGIDPSQVWESGQKNKSAPDID